MIRSPATRTFKPPSSSIRTVSNIKDSNQLAGCALYSICRLIEAALCKRPSEI